MEALINFLVLATNIRADDNLWSKCEKSLFETFSKLCSSYLTSVEMPRLVLQSNCPYLSLAERLRCIPVNRTFDRLIITKCLQLFRAGLNIEPIPEGPYEPMPWDNPTAISTDVDENPWYLGIPGPPMARQENCTHTISTRKI